MITIETILCPVDFFPASEKAADYAAHLARIYGASVHLLHVITPPGTIASEYPVDTEAIIKSLEDVASHDMKSLVRRLGPTGLSVTSELQTGDVFETIKQHISWRRPDLVVMGTHGRTGISRWFLGSVTESLIRISPAPLLTISPHQTNNSPAFRRILVTIDFSSATADALDYAYSIARQNDSEITLLHVVDDTTAALSIKYEDSLIQGVRNQLEDLIPQALRNRCKISTRVEEGLPHRVIVRALQQVKPDLLVMNIHAKGMLDRALHGSTAERVVRVASCPVMLVPRIKVNATMRARSSSKAA